MSQYAQIRKEACRVVANIAASTVSRIQKVVESPGIVPTLIKSLSEDSPGVKDEAARAIGNALTGGSAEQVRTLVDAGCVEPLCDFLPGLDDEDAVASVIDGMRRIRYLGELQSRAKVGDVEGGDGAINNNNLLAAKIAKAGGLSKIQALQTHRNDEVREVSHAFVAEYFGC
jgi:importin subunit alpha-6/7